MTRARFLACLVALPFIRKLLPEDLYSRISRRQEEVLHTVAAEPIIGSARITEDGLLELYQSYEWNPDPEAQAWLRTIRFPQYPDPITITLRSDPS